MSGDIPAAVQELLDKQALHELVLNYCRASDRRDLATIRSLYHDDAIDDHGAMFSGPVDEFIAWLPSAMANFEATSHIVANALFSIDGDHANGEIYALAYHRTRPPDAEEILITGRYLDRYERRDGVWRFIHRSLALDGCEAHDVRPDAYSHFAAGATMGSPDEADPSYGQLPLFRRGLKV